MIKVVFIFFFFISFLFANEKVILQLKWFHQFQFAGYYAAKEKGFYDEVGLDVEIKQRDLHFNNIEQVINGDAQYGIADSVLMLYKARNEPVVIVSPIFQHSPNALVSLKSKKIESLYDLEDKSILFYPNDTDGLSILSMLKKSNLQNVNIIREREKEDYVKLINDEIDLMAVYLSNEPFFFKEKGIDINIIEPSHYGYDLYGDMLFTNEKEVKNHPNRVERFKKASLKGWEYALNNKDEIIQLIYNKYTQKKTLEHLAYEAKIVEQLISKDTTTLGTFDKGRLKYINDLYLSQGLTKEKLDIKKVIFEDFLFEENLNLSEEEIRYIENKQILKVANLKSFPPYNYSINEKAQGYIIDYMKLFGKILNVEIEFVSQPWNKFIDLLNEDKLDVVPHMAINEYRKKFVTYLDIAPISYQTALGVPVNSSIKSLRDLENKTLSILDNSFLETIIRKKYPNIKLITTKTAEDAINLVASNSVNAVIGDLSILEYNKKNKWLSNIKIIKTKESDNIPSLTPLYIAVKKDNLILKNILEKTYKTLSQNEIIKLKTKWLDKAHVNSLDFTKKEYDYLKNKKRINYCIQENRMPIENTKDNSHHGLTSDFIKIIEDKIDIKFNLVSKGKQIDDIFENSLCEIQLLGLKSKKKKDNIFYTKDYISFPLVIATRLDKPYISSFNILEEKKIVYLKNSIDKKVISNKYPFINLIEVESIEDGLKMVYNKKVYGFLGTLSEVGFNIQKEYPSKLKISGDLGEYVGYSFFTTSENKVLISILNKIFDSISNREKEILYNKWNSIKYETNINIKNIIGGIIIFSLILFIIIYKNRQINAINKEMKRYIKIIDEHVLISTIDTQGNIKYVSKAFCEKSGFKKNELIGENHNIVRSNDISKDVFKALWQTIKSGKKWQGEIKNKRKDGSFYWTDLIVEPVFNEKNKIISYMSIRHDITDKKRIEEISITDELTRLYNRRYFNQIFHQELFRAKREKHCFSLIIFDVDFFKQYNDNYGHQKGDDVLIKIAKEMKSVCKRTSDFPFRIGGEEFAIIFSPRCKDSAFEFASMIRESIENLKIEHSYSKTSKHITVSVGLYSEQSDKLVSEKDIYNFADQALYKAKANGKNQVFMKNN